MFRRGVSKDLSITIAEIEADKPATKASAREDKPKAPAAGQSIGLAVSELADAQKKELKVKGGVKIDSAVEAAARAGLREGDIILALANTDVASVKEFEAALAKHDKTKPLPVLIRRGELAQFVIIKPAR